MKRLYGAVIVIAIIAVGTLTAAEFDENSAISLYNPKVLDSLQYNIDLEFPGVADLSIRGYCPPANISQTCDLMVSVALSTSTSGTNNGLATRSLTMRVVNSPFVQLAVASGDNPGPSMKVSYGEDSSGLKFASVATPSTVGGGTWDYDFFVVNAPLNNGQESIHVVIDVQLVHTGLLGHDYNLEADVSLPSAS